MRCNSRSELFCSVQNRAMCVTEALCQDVFILVTSPLSLQGSSAQGGRAKASLAGHYTGGLWCFTTYRTPHARFTWGLTSAGSEQALSGLSSAGQWIRTAWQWGLGKKKCCSGGGSRPQGWRQTCHLKSEHWGLDNTCLTCTWSHSVLLNDRKDIEGQWRNC